MTPPALVEAPPRPLRSPSTARSTRAARIGRGRLTLEQRLDLVLGDLAADGVAECPVCRGRMTPHGGGGRCTSCGSSLS